MAARRAGWFVYVLRCGDGSLYTGATNDLARRVERHARGKGGRYTRSRLPVVLVHAERAGGRGPALRREAALKRLPRAAKLALVAGRVGARTTRRSPHPLLIRALAGKGAPGRASTSPSCGESTHVPQGDGRRREGHPFAANAAASSGKSLPRM